MEFSDDFIAQVLHDIYRRGKAQSPTDLSPELFRAILRRFNEATAQSMAAADVPDLDDDFRQALRHSNEVFSAFKVHRMQSDMARLLTDSNGDLKPFNQWANDVLPIASHQCGAWLRTIRHGGHSGTSGCRLAAVPTGGRRTAKSQMDAIHIAQSGRRPSALLEHGPTHQRPLLERTPAGRSMELQMLAYIHRRAMHCYAFFRQGKQSAARTRFQSRN